MSYFTLASALIFGAFTTVATAETIVVNSGAHSGFSRLVIQFEGPVPNWSMGSTDQGYGIHIDQPGLILDLGNIYHRISRDHISEAAYDVEAQIISLETDCLCHATAFTFRNHKLVIDVKSGAAPENSEFEQLFEPLSNSLPQPNEPTVHPASVEGLPRISRQDELPENFILSVPYIRPPGTVYFPFTPDPLPDEAPFPQLARRLPYLPPPPEDQIEETISDSAQTITAREDNSDSSQMPDAEQLLLLQISRAASQGLLEPKMQRLPEIYTTKPRTLPSTAENNESDTLATLAHAATEHINIHAETSIDHDLSPGMVAPDMMEHEQLCEIGNLYDIRGWGHPDNIVGAITKTRGELLDATGRVNPDAVDALIKSYLYAGFAAEAMQLLVLFPAPETQQERKVYADIAQLSDPSNTPGASPASELQNCANAGAFWALLALNSVPRQNVNHQSILSTASSLPPHLRNRLGSRLIRIYQAAGLTGYAQSVRDAILRPGMHASHEFLITEALRPARLNETAPADVALLDVVQQNSLNSVEALETFLNNQLNDHIPINPSMIENAEALSFEYSNSETGLRLKTLLSRTYAQSGRFKDAARELQRIQKEGGADRTAPVWNELAALLNQLPDSEFIIEIYGLRKELTEAPLNPAAHRALASRLADQGFSEFAISLMPEPRSVETEDRVVLAAAAFEAGKFREVLELTSQMERSAAYPIRSAALRRLGAYAQGALEARAMNDIQTEATFNWRSGNWADISEISDIGEIRSAAIIMMKQNGISGEPGIDDPPPGTNLDLGYGEDILERSAAERETMNTLLDRFAFP